MPIAGLANLIALAGNNKFIEPVKRNNARLRIVTDNLLGPLRAQYPDDRGYLETVGKALAGDVYPLDVSFTPPPISTESRTHRGVNNITINYAGYTSFGSASCTFNNWIGADTYRFFYRWATLPGALSLQFNDTILEPAEPQGPLPLPDLSSQRGGYKATGYISQYYTYNPSFGDEVEYGRWVLEGMWPSAVSTSGFDLGGDLGSMVMTTVEFSVDLCMPVQPETPRPPPMFLNPATGSYETLRPS